MLQAAIPKSLLKRYCSYIGTKRLDNSDLFLEFMKIVIDAEQRSGELGSLVERGKAKNIDIPNEGNGRMGGISLIQ